MSETREIRCDSCYRDLTYTGNSVDYRLVLKSERQDPWYKKDGEDGGFVTDMYVSPAIKGTKHFCHLSCLRTWLDKSGDSHG